MKQLIVAIEQLKNNSEIKSTVDKRISEFKSVGKEGNSERFFSELAFCILTANFNAEKSIMMQQQIGDGFANMSEHQLAKKLRQLGHRYPEPRANYIANARKHKWMLKQIISDTKDEQQLRKWLAGNIKGVGYKLASHFLRNIGFQNLAIIDFHIVDVLVKHSAIERPKTLTPKRYLEIEEVLRQLAAETNLTLAELDLYLWYMETGKILK